MGICYSPAPPINREGTLYANEELPRLWWESVQYRPGLPALW